MGSMGHGAARRHSKLTVFLLLVTGLALCARAFLPIVIKKKINEELAQSTEYQGHVEDVDLALWRGNIEFEGIDLRDRNQTLYIQIQKAGVSVQWTKLLRKAYVGNLEIQRPLVDLVVSKPAYAAQQAKQKASQVNEFAQQKTGRTISDLLKNVFPFRINQFRLNDGEFSLRSTRSGTNGSTPSSQRPMPVLTKLNIEITNLTNSVELSTSPVSSGKMTARIAGEGYVEMNLHINIGVEPLAFDSTLVIEKFDLHAVEEFLEWQTGLQFKRGLFALYSEAKVANGGFTGYVMPFVEDLEVEAPEGQNRIILKIKKVVVNTAADIFSNKDTKNAATRIPFEGRFDTPNVDIWRAAAELLRNAFVTAITPSLDPGIKI